MAATTTVGFLGPMRAYATFAPKEAQVLGGNYIVVPGSYRPELKNIPGSYDNLITVPGSVGEHY